MEFFLRSYILTILKYLTTGILAFYFVFSTSFLSITHQTILGFSFIAIIIVLTKNKNRIGQFGRIFVMVLCFFLTMRYLIFRITVTIYYDGIVNYAATILLFSAELYGILIYLMGMLVNVWPIRRTAIPLDTDEEKLPSVDIYIPTYNEPVEMVEITIIAATQIDYPDHKKNIYVLDDGGTSQKLNSPDKIQSAEARKRADALKKICADHFAFYSTRERNIGAKAGNINELLMGSECFFDEDAFDKVTCVQHGVNKGSGDLVLILDCDHVPAKDFLQKSVGFFIKDPKLFLLQTPHYFINPNPVEKNLDIFQDGPGENEMFYGAIHPGLDFWNASFFCGSAAVLRRKYLMESGGVSGNTITEDAETSLELHAKGYTSAYLCKPLIIGLAPEIFTDFIVQRSRWAQGMIQIFILKNPVFKKGLTFFQKVCYLNATLFWFFGVARIIFFVSPLFLLFFGLRSYNASIEQVGAYVIPHLGGAYLLTNFLFGRFRRPFFSELFETIQSIYLLPAIFSVLLNPRAPVFKVTPKEVSLRKAFLSDLATPFYIMTLVSLAAYGFGIYNLIYSPLITDSIIICLIWNTFNVVLVLSCLGVVWEKRQTRVVHRYDTDEEAKIEVNKKIIPCRITDLSVKGIGLAVDKVNADEIPENFILHAENSYGEGYALDLKLRNRISGDYKTKLGCTFEISESLPLDRIVSFVYGDSSRWKFFSEQNLTGSISIFSGFIRLLKTGIQGFLINLKGVFPILTAVITKPLRRLVFYKRRFHDN